MSGRFDPVDVSGWSAHLTETLGTKDKVWLMDGEGKRWLFKHRRNPQTGDDWSEVVAAGAARLLGVPHAEVALATLEGQPGVISLDFTDDRRRGTLLLGSRLLQELYPEYPNRRRVRLPEYTVGRVLRALSAEDIELPQDFHVPGRITTAADLFLGFLVLDTLVGNTDRHQDNWGILVGERGFSEGSTQAYGPPPKRFLAPSFDHASSLGRELLDEERSERLRTRDRNYTVEAYARRCRSRFFGSLGDLRPLSPIEAFRLAAAERAEAGRYWIERVGALDAEELKRALDLLPSDRISEEGRAFAARLVVYNQGILKESTPP